MITLFVFIRMAAECALWFGCGGLVLGIFTPVNDMTAALPLLGLCAAVCSLLGEKRQPLRFAGLLLLLGLIPLCRSVGDGLLLLPAAVYLADSVLRNKLRPDGNNVYYQFKTIAGFAMLGCILCVVGSNEWCFLCNVLSVVLYLFLSRMLRHQAADFRDRHLVVLELLLLTAVCLAALLFSRKFMLTAAVKLLKQLYFLVIYPILLLILYILYGIFMVLSHVLSFLFSGEAELPQTQMLQLADGISEIMGQDEPAAANPVAMLLLRLLGAAAFLFVGYLVMRFLRKGAGRVSGKAEPGDTRRQLDRDGGRNAFSPPSVLDRSPEAGVRRAYLSYCRWLKDAGTKLTRSDTTRDINLLAGREGDPAASELRQLYLAARYRGRSGLTREDAKRASALAKEIMGKAR